MEIKHKELNFFLIHFLSFDIMAGLSYPAAGSDKRNALITSTQETCFEP